MSHIRSKIETYIIGRNTDMLETAKETLLSLLFPRRCPVCHGIVTPKGGLICDDCRGKISRVKEPCCKRCGKPVLTWEEEYCYDCSRKPRSFTGGVSLIDYDDVGKSSMIAFKYKGRQEYGAFYAEELWRTYGDRIRSFRPDVIVPVPIHRSRRAERGYNQAEVLGRELSKRSGIPMVTDLLVRSRKTVAQKKLNAGERQRNLEEALSVKGSTSGIRRVLLVDDIYTTGSTLEACTRVLLRSGVEEVFVATVCIGKNM